MIDWGLLLLLRDRKRKLPAIGDSSSAGGPQTGERIGGGNSVPPFFEAAYGPPLTVRNKYILCFCAAEYRELAMKMDLFGAKYDLMRVLE
jgi:hypothetical protein